MSIPVNPWLPCGIAPFVVLTAAGVCAAPPDVKSLFPTGGQRGQTMVLAVTGNVGAPPAAVWCSRPDVKIEPAADSGKYILQVPADAAPGVCWLRWHNAEGASPLKPFAIGTLPESVEKEPNNELAAATLLDPPRGVVSGILDKAGDVDVFAVPLKRGETLVASLDANRTFGSPMDAALQIVSPKGFVLAQNHDEHGLDPQATRTAETDGTHYVRVFAFPSEPNSTIVLAGGPNYLYRLTLTNGPYADFALPMAVTRGQPAEVRVLGWNLPAEWAALPVAIDPSADDAGLVHHVDLANALAVRIVPHASLIETETGPENAPVPVAVPATITGRIDRRRDVDLFSFAAKKGARLGLRCEARSLGSPLDPVIRILDASSKLLQENDDAQRGEEDAALVWAAPADGEYRIEVRDLYGDGGPRYFYRLTFAPEQPDVSLTIAADLIVLPADKPLEIPVTIARTAGFAAELEVAITGLPEGITAPPVKSLPKDDSAKMVKLVVQRSGDAGVAFPAGVPIRIIARTNGDATSTRYADAPIAGVKHRTRDLWLTIAPAR